MRVDSGNKGAFLHTREQREREREDGAAGGAEGGAAAGTDTQQGRGGGGESWCLAARIKRMNPPACVR